MVRLEMCKFVSDSARLSAMELRSRTAVFTAARVLGALSTHAWSRSSGANRNRALQNGTRTSIKKTAPHVTGKSSSLQTSAQRSRKEDISQILDRGRG